VLKLMEATDEYRSPEKYYFSVFDLVGNAMRGVTGVEGHHLIQNYTVVDGK